MPKQTAQRIIDSRDRAAIRQLQAQISAVAPVDHGALTGLGDDDHTQYLPTTGARAGATAAAQTFTLGVADSTLTASRLLASNGSKQLSSVANLAAWIAGTANQVTVTDDGDGSITLSLPQNIHTAATPTFAGVIAAYLRPAADSATALQLQNAAGTAQLTVDTSAGAVLIPKLALGTATAVGATRTMNLIAAFADATGTNYGGLFTVTNTRTANGGHTTLYGLRFLLDHNSTYNETGAWSVHQASARNLGSGNMTGSVKALHGTITNSGGGSMTAPAALYAEIANSAGSTIITAYGLRVVWTNSATITTGYGIYVPDVTAGTPYAIYTGTGLVRFGDALTVVGSIATAYAAKTDNYTLTANDSIVALSVAGKTLTLPTAVGCAGRRYTLKATNTSGSISVATTSSQTIDGATTQTLLAGEALEVVSTGANWIAV